MIQRGGEGDEQDHHGTGELEKQADHSTIPSSESFWILLHFYKNGVSHLVYRVCYRGYRDDIEGVGIVVEPEGAGGEIAPNNG